MPTLISSRVRRFLATCLAALIIQMTASGAAPLVQWATVAGGPGRDYPHGIALAPAGELYLVGDFEQEVNGGWDRPTKVLYKFDISGTLINSQASRGESIKGVAVDPQGNYYLTGRVWDSRRLGLGQNNAFYLAKYSSTGTLLWERATGSPSPGGGIKYEGNGGSKIVLDAAGNIYVTGASYGPAVFGNVTFPDTPGGPLLCKYDQHGTLLWGKRVEGTSLIFENFNSGVGGSANDLALDRDGNLVITGYLNDGKADFGGTVINIDGPYSGYFFVAKFNGAGEVQWAKQSHGGYGVAVDRTGNMFCTGDAVSADPDGLNGTYFGKLAADGNPIWEKVIKGAYARSMTLDGKDNPILVASLYQTVQLDDFAVPYNGIGRGWDFPEILICKADSAGKFQWAITESGAPTASAGPVYGDRDGNIYVAGAIGCGIDNGAEVCGTGMLGSFPLELLFPDAANHGRDLFVSRLIDPDAVATELKFTRIGNGITLSWPVSLAGFGLESATALPAANWSAVPGTPSIVGDQNVVTVETGNSSKLFRLRKP